MAINNQLLVEAFNDCIDGLNRGKSIASVLRNFPDLATQLSPMLESGLLIKKARYPINEVAVARENISPRIEDAINSSFDGGSTTMNWYTLLLILLFVGAVMAGIYTLRPASDVPQLVSTATSPQESPTATDSLSATITPRFTSEPTMVLATITPSTASESTKEVSTVTLTATVEPTMALMMVIEGPVSNIQGNIITIYNQNIELSQSDLRLTVIQLGDVLRVQTSTDGQSIAAFDITFVNVLVVVSVSGQIWRGDDCNNPPPAWINVNTNSWLMQCNRSNSNNSSSSSNSNTSTNNNNNDSDDDDEADEADEAADD